jgi:putative transposase
VVGWAIDSHQATPLVTNALGMAITNRNPQPEQTVIHSDHGSQGEFNWSSQHLEHGGVDGTTTGLGCSGDGKAADVVAWSAAGGAA